MTQQPLPFDAPDVTLYSGPRHTGGWWAVAVLRVTFGEESDGDLARGEGATLAEAVDDIRDAVEARAARLRALLAGGAP